MYGGEGGGYCHVSQIYERQQFEVVKGDFWLECLTIFATGCSPITLIFKNIEKQTMYPLKTTLWNWSNLNKVP